MRSSTLSSNYVRPMFWLYSIYVSTFLASSYRLYVKIGIMGAMVEYIVHNF